MDYLHVEKGICSIITIDRPKALNALNAQVMSELDAALTEAAGPETRTIILTGAGEKAFVAGADITQFVDMTSAEALEFARHGQALFNRIEQSPIPVIAAVNGFALGGGCELAMACHIRIASESAVFGQPEVKLGLIAGFGGTQRLPRLIGKGRAIEILVTGRMVKAHEAERIGLVNKVVPAEELLDSCRALGEEIAKQAPLAVGATIMAIIEGLKTSPNEGMQIEATLFSEIFKTEDVREGTRAFVEKRNADFKGK